MSVQLPDDLMQPISISSLSQSTQLTVPSLGMAQPWPNALHAATRTSPADQLSLRTTGAHRISIKLWRKLLSRRCCTESSWLNYASDFQGYLPCGDRIIFAVIARCNASQNKL